MAKQASLYLPANGNNQGTQLVNGTGTTKTTAFTADATDDSDIKAIVVTSTCSAAFNLQIWVLRASPGAATANLLGTVNIPINSGANGTVNAVDALNSVAMPGLPLDSVGKRYIPLDAGDSLQVSGLAALTDGVCYVNVFGQDY